MSDQTRTMDPLDSATQAGERADTYFGKIEVTAQYVTLVKGQGKKPWTEGMDPDDRRTEINLHLNPLDEMGLTRPLERSIIAESREWTGIVWPSLRELGLKHARELHGKWAKVALEKTGRSYTNREGRTIENTTMKFLALYETQEECLAAWENQYGTTGEAHSTPNNGASASSDTERATALQFLPALVKAANGDQDILAQSLASMPMISKHFTVDSPEIQDLMKGS